MYQFEVKQVASSSAFCDSELYKQHAQPGIESSWTLPVCQLKQVNVLTNYLVFFILEALLFLLSYFQKLIRGGKDYMRAALTLMSKWLICTL